MLEFNKKILYIGPLSYGGTCFQRLKAFEDIGFSVFPVDTGMPSNTLLKFIFRVWRKFGIKSWVYYINKKINNSLTHVQPEIVWVDKGLAVQAQTLLNIKLAFPKVIMVSYSPDDMINPNNQTSNYIQCIPLYDYHITTKSYNIEELKKLGAQRVVMIDNSYCHHSHKPILLSSAEKNRIGGVVGFIGGWEKEREQYLIFLAESGIPVRIWGEWKKNKKFPKNMLIEGRTAWGDDYARVVSSFDINLSFLRKENRDLQTTRSIEIPACGGFMIAERTKEHLSLFNEGVEAEFFGDKEELLEKVNYYIQHIEKRNKIAQSGLARCIRGGYSNKARLESLMEMILL